MGGWVEGTEERTGGRRQGLGSLGGWADLSLLDLGRSCSEITCSKTPYSLPLPPSPPPGRDPCSCVFTSPRSNSPERKLSEMRPQAWLPFRVATAAGQGLSPDGVGGGGWGPGEEGASPRRGHGPRAPGPWAGQGDRPAGGSPAGHGDLHLGGRDAARQGVELAQRRHVLGLLHCPPCPPPRPKLVSPCALHASREQLKPRALPNYGAGAEAGGKGRRRAEREEGAWEVREGRGRRERGPRTQEG